MSHRVKADDGRIWLFDKVLIEQRGDYWHFRMWLDGENKYVRESLKTRDLETAKKRAEDRYIELRSDQKSGKRYFSITAACWLTSKRPSSNALLSSAMPTSMIPRISTS